MVSGALVGGGWIYQLVGWGRENFVGGVRGKREPSGRGMLHGRGEEEEGEDE